MVTSTPNTYVGSDEKLAKDYPGLLKLPGDGRTVAYYPKGGGPCWCWVDWEGNPIPFRESRQSSADTGLRDMVWSADRGPPKAVRCSLVPHKPKLNVQ